MNERLDRNQGGHGHAQETVDARRAPSTSADGRAGNWQRTGGTCRLSEARAYRAHGRPLEERRRWAARGSSHAAEGAGAGASAPQADCCRPSAGSLDPQGGRLGTLLSPTRKREAVGHAVAVLHGSERRACRAIGQIRSSSRYVPRPDLFREQVRQRIIALAKEYGRYGYRTVTDLLRREGWSLRSPARNSRS